MEDKIYEAIGVWARPFTWFTSHPADEKRFHEAITNIYEQIGPDVSEEDFRNALKRHRSENTEGLGGKPNDEMLEKHVQRAMDVIAYLKNQGEHLKE
ncbi:MAG: hypothetical protein KF811_04340 [Dokdonella sp.]|nr:hypothetical protein [Dokdonella sp.]